MKDPLVSVIIPAYNAASTIGRAVQSVIGQTYSYVEIIVVDDGSTDNLDDAVAPYSVRIFRQANLGASAARNHGSRVAKGDFLAFLDADDFWHPDKLKRQIYATRLHPDARYFVTKGCTVTSAVDELEPQRVANDEYPLLEVIEFPAVFKDPYFGTPGVMISKALFEAVGGFNETLTTAEDVDLWLRAAHGGTVVRIREVLFYVVRTKNSLSAKFVDRTYSDNIHIIDQFCKNHPEFFAQHRRAVNCASARVYCDWGSEAISRGDRALAREKLALSLRAKPTFRSLYLYSKALLLRIP